jgi:hypothetical protein
VSLKSEVESLERKLGLDRRGPGPPPDIVITFVQSDGAGHPDPNQEIVYATIYGLDGLRFDRQPGEAVKDFTSRIISTQERHPCVVLLHCE